MKISKSTSAQSTCFSTIGACLAGILAASPVWAAGVSIPANPIQTNTNVPPNIMVLFDDSGSMQETQQADPEMAYFSATGMTSSLEWNPATTYNKDDIVIFNGNTYRADNPTTNNPPPSSSGYWSYGELGTTVNPFGLTGLPNRPNFVAAQSFTFNALYYNPLVEYKPWRKSDGSYYADASYASAWNDVDELKSPIDLASATRVFYAPKSLALIKSSKVEDYYRYELTSTGARQCEWNGASWGCVGISSFDWSGFFSKDRLVADEKANFANWYAYHRTRNKMAKAAMAVAFQDLGDGFRLGFWEINDNTANYRIPVATDDGLFRGANRSDWYTALFKVLAESGTPLRKALDNAGSYFQDTTDAGPWSRTDKTQITCRRNFTLLTTDGYWKDADGSVYAKNSDNVDGPNGYLAVAPYSSSYANTLADVAMHYWKNDLRPTMADNVPTSGADDAKWQHMVTYGIAIGLQGKLAPTAATLALIKAGTEQWPDPRSLTVLDGRKLDDLWHATVNSRGKFLSAQRPAEFVAALRAALADIVERTGSASNVAANSVSVGTDSLIFQAKYTTNQWIGQLTGSEIIDGKVSTTPKWQATEQIPAWDKRNIFSFNGSAGSTFPTASQLTALGSADMANYLKGDDSKSAVNGGSYRDRVNLLGDIVNSSPAYVKEDDTANAGKYLETVYVGANDGMLHAFNAVDGKELFAYVPNIVNMANLKKLADKDYGSNHQYFVDGPVIVSTRKQAADKNILVGSLGRGGKGLYALNVTTPSSFSASNVLWEKDGTDVNMGMVISRPFIAKLNNGVTAVIVSNGINSTDDRPALLIYNLETGAKIGSALVPAEYGTAAVTGNNGLSAASGIDDDGNGTLDYVYAGDLKGNLWKFDLSDKLETKWKIDNAGNPLFVAKDPLNNAQSISGGVALSFDATGKPWVFFGTGRYLSTTDPADLSVQTWYGIRDDGSTVATTRVGTAGSMLYDDLKKREIIAAAVVNDTKVRAFESQGYNDMSGKKGWYIDLVQPPSASKLGERIVGTPIVRGSSLIASSIIPDLDPCGVGGSGYVNVVDVFTGSSGIAGSNGYLDFNRDGNYSNDKLTTSDGKKVAIGSIDLAVYMPTDSVVLANATNDLIVVGGSQGGTGTAPLRNTRAVGRISWHEIINN